MPDQSPEFIEDVSAAADDELPPQRARLVFAGMGSRTDLAGKWERYHLIRDTLRNALDERVACGFSDRVARRLVHEPAHRSAVSGARVGAWAVAAGVAAAALLLAWTLPRPDPGSQIAARSQPALRVAAERTVPTADKALDRYLIGHNEQARQLAGSGMLGYARVVSHADARGR